jgi:hypothetical protein
MLRDLEDQMFLVQTLIIGALVGLVLVAFELVTERLGTVEETDVLLFDEPGRCGGLDSHCHHYRVVERHGSRLLLVRNGGGDTSIRLSGPVSIPLLSLDSNGRYWLLNAIFHAQADGAMGAYARERAVWKQAAAEKRIRTRKQRGGNGVKVWIEDKAGA